MIHSTVRTAHMRGMIRMQGFEAESCIHISVVRANMSVAVGGDGTFSDGHGRVRTCRRSVLYGQINGIARATEIPISFVI
jgi:hypothetical protein